MPASNQATAILPGLSPIGGRPIEAKFDAALMSSDGGLLLLREIEQRLGIARRLAACMRDPRAPGRIVHGLDEILRFRMLMIAAGYEDGNDADSLRGDVLFKLAMDRLPSHGDLCSQSTVSRTENLPDRHALLRMGHAIIDHYCQSFRKVPRRIVLDVDDTFDAVHGGRQLRLFNGHHDEYGFQPIVAFDGEGRMIAALLRPACRPSGRQIVFWLRRLITALRNHWPRVEILLRADRHYCTPEMLRCCRAARLDYVLGVAPTTTLRKHVTALEASTTARARAGGEKLRRFKEFYDGPAGCGHTLHRHQPRWRPRTHRLRRHLLRPRPGREPHQGLEDPSRRRPHVMLPGCRQPDALVPAPRRLLADVEPAGRDATTLALARRPIRYPAAAPDQTRRQGRNAEAQAPAPPAALDPKPNDLRLRADPPAAHGHLRDGAYAPLSPRPFNPQRRRHCARPTPNPGALLHGNASAHTQSSALVHDRG